MPIPSAAMARCSLRAICLSRCVRRFTNVGRIIANGNLQWNLSGLGLINQGVISAGRALNLYAAKLDNRQEGEISAGENHLTVNGELVNRGLIDGGLTHIVATTLTNIGSGRLYGDAVALRRQR
ncbi:hypothetical protein LNP17_04175 [Klebsiella variicola subsp. variicola]|nr:hypothetical protein [Klebsiella variicola subsp. variicola]